jgi:hypothetical protein
MKFHCCLMVLVAGLGMSAPAHAAEPGCEWWRSLWQPLSQPHACCPNDYCPKPAPPAPYPVCNCGPKDYCPKPAPNVCPLKYTGLDDYCTKVYPPSPSPCYPPWYTCGFREACTPPPSGAYPTTSPYCPQLPGH